MNRKYLIFIGIIAVGIMAIVLFDGYWPAAFVGYNSISYRTFEKSYQTSFKYYQNSLIAEREDLGAMESEDFKKDLKRAVLESLIEQKIIKSALKEKLGKKDFKDMVAAKIEKFNADSEYFKLGSQLLYGVSAEDFKKIVLEPMAQRELLEGRLFGDNKKLIDWFVDEKPKTRVLILTSGFYWSGDSVVVE